jgi:hypothetical protein
MALILHHAEDVTCSRQPALAGSMLWEGRSRSICRKSRSRMGAASLARDRFRRRRCAQ